ncbi:cyclic nucleotide-binding domain-containing protein [Actinomadura hibisca]|uniref:cyclic nucleotide-binding domain-containing protein n=1 Tax=Actinomadura hibisca TaxID=68565 RepID=UPI00082FE26B|nr:cyclic nucleotide-binding domain-containing protein [Actinomadura hibisca]
MVTDRMRHGHDPDAVPMSARSDMSLHALPGPGRHPVAEPEEIGSPVVAGLAQPARTAPPAPEGRQPQTFWQSLTPVEQAAFTLAAEEVVLPAGYMLWRVDEIADHLLVILTGWAKVCVERDGREQIIAVRGAGDLLGERAALLLRRRSASVFTLDTLRFLRMSTRQFAAFLSVHPRVLAVMENQVYDRLTEEPYLQELMPKHTSAVRSATGSSLPGARPPEPWAAFDDGGPDTPDTPYATGAASMADRTGAAGPAGPMGVSGQRGAAGPTRPMDVAGATGQAGAAGHMSAADPMGAAGAAGPAGTASGVLRLVPSPAGSPERPTWAGQMCTILFTDIVGFSGLHRRDDDRLRVRRVMYDLLREALEGSAVPWPALHREDRGDGALLVAPPEIPTRAVTDPMLTRLAEGLRRHNLAAPEAERFQMRVALHVGPVVPDAEGVSGWAIIQTARLLDAPVFKRAMARTSADLGFITSTFVYETVIAQARGSLDPAGFRHVADEVKTLEVSGWMHLSGASA